MTEIPAEITVWMDAHRSVPDYAKLYSHVCACAGDGDKVTPEQLGMSPRSFAFDTLYLLRIPGGYVIYSMEEKTGEMDVELLSNYLR